MGSLPEDPERFPFVHRGPRPAPRRDSYRCARCCTAWSLRPPGEPDEADAGRLEPARCGSGPTRTRPGLYNQWVRHVATGVSGLEMVDVFERPEDKHLVLRARFAGSHGDPVPSWLLSDGTLRLMALTLLSFASSTPARDAYLIEEPENGLHPLAMQTMLEALSRPPTGMQVLLASHSPILLGNLRLEEVMVFRRHSRRLGRRASRRRGPRAARLEGSCQPRRPLRLRCARMIVDDPPYELIVLFADEDARRLVMGLIERGQERRCLRPFRWRAIRDPRRDAVVKAPDAALRPFVGRAEHRFVVLWDHSGAAEMPSPRRPSRRTSSDCWSGRASRKITSRRSPSCRSSRSSWFSCINTRRRGALREARRAMPT